MLKITGLLIFIATVIHNIQSVPTRTYCVLVHNATGKVVSAEGHIIDWEEGAKDLQWIPYWIEKTYYVLKWGKVGRPELLPNQKEWGSRGDYVLGAHSRCLSSTMDKQQFIWNESSVLWDVKDGVGELFNRCDHPKQQLVLKGQVILRGEDPSKVTKGDKNNLFELVTVEDYLKRIEKSQ